MKFRSERDSLVEAFSTTSRAVGGRGTSSVVLSGLLLECSGNRLIATGTDLDLTIRVEQEVIGLEDGACVVPARLAADIVRSLEPGAVTVEALDVSNAVLFLVSDESRHVTGLEFKVDAGVTIR